MPIPTFILARLTDILAVAWILVAARQLLFWLYFIQLKQYRPDRLWLAVRHRSFFRLLVSPFRLGVYGLFFIWAVVLRVDVALSALFSYLYLLVVAFYAAFACHSLFVYATGRMKLPKLTAKIILLFTGILTLESVLLFVFYRFWPEQLLAIDILQPFIVLGLFGLLWLPNSLSQKRLMAAATRKRREFSDLKVIGITGSYGKTRTKEYLAHILESKYRVLKTPNHLNVDTGVAKLVLSQLTGQTQIMVVEMGAYKRGEIKTLCDIVQPQYGILAGLSNQHLELFGSHEAIEQAKFELADEVRDTSRLFANADSEPLMSAFTRRGLQPVTYGLQARSAQYKPEQITYAGGNTNFTLQGQSFSAPIFSSAALTNLSGAIAAAHRLGMNLPEIAKAVATLPAIEQNMAVSTGKNGATLIDSSYNANTDGVISALQDLRLFKGKRIAIFKEVIELGPDARQDHQRMAAAMAKTLDAVVLLASPYRQLMEEALREHGMQSEQIFTPDHVALLSDQAEPDTVILFLGRGSELLLKHWQH